MNDKLLAVGVVLAIVFIFTMVARIPTAQERRDARPDVIKPVVLSDWNIIAENIPYDKVLRVHDGGKNVTCWIVTRNGSSIDCIPDSQLVR